MEFAESSSISILVWWWDRTENTGVFTVCATVILVSKLHWATSELQWVLWQARLLEIGCTGTMYLLLGRKGSPGGFQKKNYSCLLSILSTGIFLWRQTFSLTDITQQWLPVMFFSAAFCNLKPDDSLAPCGQKTAVGKIQTFLNLCGAATWKTMFGTCAAGKNRKM